MSKLFMLRSVGLFGQQRDTSASVFSAEARGELAPAFSHASPTESAAEPRPDDALPAHSVPGLSATGARILIRFAPEASAGERLAALAGIGSVQAPLPADHSLTVTIGGGLTVEDVLAILADNPAVAHAEADLVLRVDAVADESSYAAGQLWGMYGSQTDPVNAFGSQAGEAWSAGYLGSTRVVVGVVDSGVDYTHPDLYLNIWLNPGEIPLAIRSALVDIDTDGVLGFRDLNATANAALVIDLNANGRIDAGDLLGDARWENGLDEDGNGYLDDLIGWDFYNGDNDPQDDNGHGTHVAGTIGAVGGNGAGVAGVSWATQMVALKFLGADGSGYLSDALDALDYFTDAAADSDGAQRFVATNNSWGGGGFSRGLRDAIVRGAQQDILFVAAAGNGGGDGVGDNNDSLANYPSNYDTAAAAGYDAVIAVASITKAGSLSSFSNYGASTVDLGAPGSGILSTLPGGGYGTMSGTSMATPHVTGAIALHAALANESAARLKAGLLAATTQTPSLVGTTVSGGRLNAADLVNTGTAADDIRVGSAADDLFRFGQGGRDSVNGADGNDSFLLGAALSDGDAIAGGDGFDILVLEGTQSLRLASSTIGGIEMLRFLSAPASGHFSYDLTMSDGNVVAGATLTIDGSALRAGETLRFNGGAERDGRFDLTGGSGNDGLVGSQGSDDLRGGGGDDIVHGSAGDDRISGGDGLDELRGQAGIDTIGGGAGNDRLYGGPGSDIMSGDADNDYLNGGADADMLDGGDGDDIVYGEMLDDEVHGGLGNDEVRGQSGNDLIYGEDGDDAVYGGPGDDWMYGGIGADILVGGGDADRLFGGLGKDRLCGNIGADIFHFGSVGESVVGNADVILDFTRGDDLIDLSAIDAISGTGADDAFTLSGDGSFHNVAGEFRVYASGTGSWFVEGDTDGNGLADFQIEVLTPATSTILTAADFVF